MIMLVVEFEVVADKGAAFEAVMTRLAGETLAREPNALLYQLGSVDGAPGHYRLVELYRDQAALDSHMTTAWFAEAGAAMRGLLAKRPAIIQHTTVNDSFSMKGL